MVRFLPLFRLQERGTLPTSKILENAIQGDTKRCLQLSGPKTNPRVKKQAEHYHQDEEPVSKEAASKDESKKIKGPGPKGPQVSR